MSKFICNNTLCKFHDIDSKSLCSLKEIVIDYHGCSNYKNGFQYYINLVWNALENTNMIPVYELTDDLKTGLYYMMIIYNLNFCNNMHGSFHFITLNKKDAEQGLNYEQIINSCEFNYEKYMELKEDFDKNGPYNPYKGKQPETENDEESEFIGYGFLSPKGKFYKEEFGQHTDLAIRLLKKYYDLNNIVSSATDDLCSKGWVLIHAPNGYHISVDYFKPLTKAQREFLYNYFMKLKDSSRAKLYLNDEG